MKAHVVENNVVVNTIEIDSLDAIPGLVDGSTGGIGWAFINGILTPPPAQSAPVPESVSKFQAKAALLQAGLLDSVEAMMAAPQTPAVAKLAWSDAQEFRRTSPTVAAMTAALGLSEGQIDDLFRVAAGIVA